MWLTNMIYKDGGYVLHSQMIYLEHVVLFLTDMHIQEDVAYIMVVDVLLFLLCV